MFDIVVGITDLSREPEAFGKVFNLGGTEEISMKRLAERIVELTNSKSELRYVPYNVAYEEGFEDMQRRMPDISRARDLISFSPSRTLDEILISVIENQKGNN